MAVLSHVCSCISHSTLFTSTAPSSSLSVSPTTFLQLSSFSTESTWNNIRRTNLCSNVNSLRYSGKTLLRHRHKYYNPCSSMASSLDESGKRSKRVWIWTSNKQVMTAAVERGWNTFVFPSHHRQLAHDWSCKFFIPKEILLSICVCVCVFSGLNLILIDCNVKLFTMWIN